MSLDYYLEDIKDFKEVCYNDEGMNNVTECLIYGCMFLDLNSITKENIKDWVLRLELNKRINRKLWGTTEGAWWPTVEMLEQHIGLRTNVAKKTNKQYAKRLMDNMLEEVERLSVRIIKEAKE